MLRNRIYIIESMFIFAMMTSKDKTAAFLCTTSGVTERERERECGAHISTYTHENQLMCRVYEIHLIFPFGALNLLSFSYTSSNSKREEKKNDTTFYVSIDVTMP